MDSKYLVIIVKAGKRNLKQNKQNKKKKKYPHTHTQRKNTFPTAVDGSFVAFPQFHFSFSQVAAFRFCVSRDILYLRWRRLVQRCRRKSMAKRSKTTQMQGSLQPIHDFSLNRSAAWPGR